MNSLKLSLLIAGLGLFCGNSAAIAADNERWFEIELLIFAHNPSDENINEEYQPQIKPILVNKARDLISPVFQPDPQQLRKFLPECADALPYLSPLQLPATADYQGPAESFASSENASYYAGISQNGASFSDDTAFTPSQNQTEESTTGSVSSDLTDTAEGELAIEQQPSVPTFALTIERPVDIQQLTFPVDAPSWLYPIHCYQPTASVLNPDREILDEADNSVYWSQMPTRITQHVDEYSTEPYLLNSEHLAFTELATKFRWRKDIRTLMHMAWRQPVKAENQEIPWRIYAGNNYSKEYSYYGEPIIAEKFESEQQVTGIQPIEVNENDPVLNLSSEQSLKHQSILNNIQQVLDKVDSNTWSIENALKDKQALEWQQQQQIAGTPKQTWQLDGLFKIYLRHYLFIETEFNIRKVGPHPEKVLADDTIKATDNPAGLDLADTFLYPYYFKQNKRIRSTEIHYFDHPHMGIVLQVRRYSPPNQPQAD
ncbi:CsiV family protein (plasmid) [Catenovulum sp. SX2]|uniref:CsiV family protein n=1 Tax=Catenovulum sp. SX2 TaxID=3398614 RepID=UPI003F87FCEF